MRKAFLTTIAAVGLLVQASASAQSPDPTTYRLTGTRIALGQDIRIERDEEVTDAAIVVGGSLNVDGRVRDGVVVVGGNLHLSSTADVRGDVVLVGGTLTRDPGAQLTGGVDYVSFGDWSRRNFALAARRCVLAKFGRWISLAGTLARVSVLGVLMAMMLIVARAPVARVGRAALAEPLRAFVIGLAAEIFFVPLLVAAVDRAGDHHHRNSVRGHSRADRDRDRRVRVRARLHRAGVPHRRVDRGSPRLAAGQRVCRDGDRIRRCCWRRRCWRGWSTWPRAAWRRSRSR